MSPGAGRTPEEIMEEIGQTRSEMANTLAALEVKLSPAGIWDELSSSLTPVRRASGDFARNLGASIRDNPLPTALIGLGVCWLAVAGGRDGRLQPRSTEPFAGNAVEEGDRLDPWRLGQKGVVDDMDEHLETNEEIRETGARISEGARRAARETRERTARLAAIAREKSGQAYHRTSEAGTRVASMARNAAADGGEFVRMHPIGVALGVLGVGAIVAAVMIARSERRREGVVRSARTAREYLQETADRTVDAARQGADWVKRATMDASERYKRAGSEPDEPRGVIDADDQVRTASQGLHDQERASIADPTSAEEPRQQPS